MIQQHTSRGTIWRKKYWRLAQIPILNLKIFFENFIHVGNEIQSYPPISHLQLLQTERHPSLSSWPFPFLFNNLLSQFSFLYVHECGPSTGAWQTCQWPYPQRRMIYQPLPHSPSSSSSVRDESLWASCHLCWSCNWLNLLLVLPFYNWKKWRQHREELPPDHTANMELKSGQGSWSWLQSSTASLHPHREVLYFWQRDGKCVYVLGTAARVTECHSCGNKTNMTVIKTG